MFIKTKPLFGGKAVQGKIVEIKDVKKEQKIFLSKISMMLSLAGLISFVFLGFFFFA